LLGVSKPRAMQGVSLLPAIRSDRRVRRLVFFDTVPGGHLTLNERWSERLQGVTDGTRLHGERLGATCHSDDPSAPELAPALAKWRRSQARARLALLSTHGGLTRPGAEEVNGYAEALEVEGPADGALLASAEASGVIRLAW